MEQEKSATKKMSGESIEDPEDMIAQIMSNLDICDQ